MNLKFTLTDVVVQRCSTARVLREFCMFFPLSGSSALPSFNLKTGDGHAALMLASMVASFGAP